MSPTLVRRVHFDCIHFYNNPDWSEERNREVFGACFTPNGHGHSYSLDVYVSGPIDSETGMVINLKDLDQVLKAVVVTVEHKHLNHEIQEFKSQIPTTENVAGFLFGKLKAAFLKALPPAVKLQKIRLYESADLWVDYWEDA